MWSMRENAHDASDTDDVSNIVYANYSVYSTHLCAVPSWAKQSKSDIRFRYPISDISVDYRTCGALYVVRGMVV